MGESPCPARSWSRGPASNLYFEYPTHNDAQPGRDLADATGNNAHYHDVTFLLGAPYWRSVVGEFENSNSPYDTFDQGGNIYEWNEALIGNNRGARGGSFEGFYTHMQATYRWDADPTTENEYLGFRVVAIPEPASLSLLALGGVGLLMRRREPCSGSRRASSSVGCSTYAATAFCCGCVCLALSPIATATTVEVVNMGPASAIGGGGLISIDYNSHFGEI